MVPPAQKRQRTNTRRPASLAPPAAAAAAAPAVPPPINWNSMRMPHMRMPQMMQHPPAMMMMMPSNNMNNTNPMTAAMFQQQAFFQQAAMQQQQRGFVHGRPPPQPQPQKNQRHQKKDPPKRQAATTKQPSKSPKQPPSKKETTTKKKAPKPPPPIQQKKAQETQKHHPQPQPQPQEKPQEETPTVQPPPKEGKTKKKIKRATIPEKKEVFLKLWEARRPTLEDPSKKTLPKGSFPRVAEELKMDRHTVWRLWNQTLERLEALAQQEAKEKNLSPDQYIDPEILYPILIEQHAATIFANNVNPDSKAVGAPAKFDKDLIRQAIWSIPMAAQRSIRSLSSALDIPLSSLHRFIEVEGDSIFDVPTKEQRRVLQHKHAKQQLMEAIEEKKRKHNNGEECQEDEEDDDDDDDEEEETDQKKAIQRRKKTPRQEAVLETTRLVTLIRDNTRCAECGQGPVELTFVTTRLLEKTAAVAKGGTTTLPLCVPRLECQACKFMAFPGNTVTSKTISTPRFVGGPIGAKSDNKHHKKRSTKTHTLNNQQEQQNPVVTNEDDADVGNGFADTNGNFKLDDDVLLDSIIQNDNDGDGDGERRPL